MKGIIRVRQGAVTRVLPNAGSGNVIPKNFHVSTEVPVKGDPWDYLTQAHPHGAQAGTIYNTAGEAALSISSLDSNGVNHYDEFGFVRPGMVLTVGSQSAIITVRPNYVGGAMWSFVVNSWPALPNGNYVCKIERAIQALNPPRSSVNPYAAAPGQLVLGAVLACGTGIWQGEDPITYAYAWQRDGAPISLATSASYTLAAADLGGKTLTCIVTATNADGSSAASSNKIWIP